MQVGQLDIVARRIGGPVPEPIENGVRLHAEVEWRLKGPPEAVREIVSELGDVCEQLDEGLALLHFGNAVGWFDVPHLGRIEVRSGKWTAAHFSRMLGELTNVAAALPFAAAAGSALPYERSVPVVREILYHAFVYLRRMLLEVEGDDNIAIAYALVLADPHQRLLRDRREVAPELARNVGPRAMEDVLCGHRRLNRAPASCDAPLAVALKGHLPDRVLEDVARRVVDTPENRFLKAFLGQLLWVVDEMGRRAPGSEVLQARRLDADISKMRRRLEAIARHGLWREIGPMTSIPESSTVLQRRRGYRELFGHFVALRLASRVPLSARDVTQLLEAKDIATLYELWCFFRVVQAVAAVEGRVEAAEAVSYTDFGARVEHGYRLRWRTGTSMAYNPRFALSNSARRSFSVPLRPDISLRVPDGPNKGLHLLDAKFKVDNLGDLLAESLDDDPEACGHSGFKRADLYKMHTYRDAIQSARSVWILYPGSQARFYDEHLTPRVDDLTSLPSTVDGVGAVPLRPEPAGDIDLSLLVSRLLAR